MFSLSSPKTVTFPGTLYLIPETTLPYLLLESKTLQQERVERSSFIIFLLNTTQIHRGSKLW